jgi:hypothetical protein
MNTTNIQPKTKRPALKLLALLLLSASLLSACAGSRNQVSLEDRQTVEAMGKAGKAYFEDKCKTAAGEKIYRTVPDVEGVLLMKVRPTKTTTQLEDPMWAGATFAREYTEDNYIDTFLGYEYGTGNNDGSKNPITKEHRGYIAPDKRPGGHPGYRYVDVIEAKDGQRVRVTQRSDEPWQYDKTYLKGYIRYFLDKTPTTAPAPRYGVTYEDHVIPEERAMGVASSTVKVLDLQTHEVLGEMVRYAYRPRGIRLTEWLTSNRCPDHAVDVGSATRKFVDQVLIPKGE